MIRCGICSGEETIAIEYRAFVPIAQNRVFASQEAARACPGGTLDVHRCLACGFVWNRCFDPALLAYDASYDNDQSFSPRFEAHADAVAESIIARLQGRDGIHLVEIGCGQGGFIAKLAHLLGDRLASARGFDPAWQGDRYLPARCDVRRQYFGCDTCRSSDPIPDAVISRHVIEHVPDIPAFLASIRRGMMKGTLLFLETPDIEWVLKRGVFFDLYYEHCSLFTPEALRLALGQAGFEVESIVPAFEDQYMVATAIAGDPHPVAAAPGRFDDRGFRAKRALFLERLGAVVEESRRHGGVALWGGASKGTTICLTLPNAHERIACVIDLNARKQGGYLPASAMELVSPEEAQRRGVATAIVVNSAYDGEVARICADKGLDFRLVSLAGIVGELVG